MAKCVVSYLFLRYQVTVAFRPYCQFTDCYYYYIVAAAAAAAVMVFDVFVVGMATRLRDGRFSLRIPVGARDFPFSKTSRLVLWPTSISYSMNIEGSSPEA